MVSMKIIVHPGSKTDQFVFSEDCTVQDVRNHIAEFLEFTGSRSPNPHNFRIWQIHPRRELAKPLMTLRQMQVPRECALLVLPPDITPPPLSNLEQLNQVLSSFNFNSTRNNTDNHSSNQSSANDDVPNQNSNANPPKEESAPKEKRTRKRKYKNEETKKGVDATDDPFIESKQYCCKICLRTFGSKRAVRSHHTRMHKPKDTTTVNVGEEAHGSAVQPDLAVTRNQEEPNENQNNFNVNITVNNNVNYNYFGLRRGDFY